MYVSNFNTIFDSFMIQQSHFWNFHFCSLVWVSGTMVCLTSHFTVWKNIFNLTILNQTKLYTVWGLFYFLMYLRKQNKLLVCLSTGTFRKIFWSFVFLLMFVLNFSSFTTSVIIPIQLYPFKHLNLLLQFNCHENVFLLLCTMNT